MRIACLHTAQSNTAAEQAGGLTHEITAQTTQALLDLIQGNDAVLLTCSTLGPAVDTLGGLTTSPVCGLRAAVSLLQARTG